MDIYPAWRPIIFGLNQFMENNASTRLPSHYKSIFVENLKKSITESQQHILIISLYCNLYHHHNHKAECVIDLSHIWYFLSLETERQSKELLMQLFTQDIDYKITKNTNRTETILLTANTFKKLYYKTESITNLELQNYSLNLIKFLKDEKSELPVDLNLNDLEYIVFTLLMIRK